MATQSALDAGKPTNGFPRWWRIKSLTTGATRENEQEKNKNEKSCMQSIHLARLSDWKCGRQNPSSESVASNKFGQEKPKRRGVNLTGRDGTWFLFLFFLCPSSWSRVRGPHGERVSTELNERVFGWRHTALHQCRNNKGHFDIRVEWVREKERERENKYKKPIWKTSTWWRMCQARSSLASHITGVGGEEGGGWLSMSDTQKRNDFLFLRCVVCRDITYKYGFCLTFHSLSLSLYLSISPFYFSY